MVDLQTTRPGSFYTAESLSFPLSAEVRYRGARLAMPTPAPHGSCNGCHLPAAGQGRVHVP